MLGVGNLSVSTSSWAWAPLSPQSPHYGKSVALCRVFGRFTLEAILATAFGRRVDMQKGESDEVSKAMDTLFTGFADGEFEQLVVFNSKSMWHFVLITLMKKGMVESPSPPHHLVLKTRHVRCFVFAGIRFAWAVRQWDAWFPPLISLKLVVN